MLHVNYENRIGYYTLHQGENKFKIWFCHANCLCAEVYFYKDEEGIDMVQLNRFFGDLKHLKNCAKAGLFEDYRVSGVTLFAKEMNDDLWKMVRVFAENGVKVTIK